MLNEDYGAISGSYNTSQAVQPIDEPVRVMPG